MVQNNARYFGCYLGGDSYPKDIHIEDALSSRLKPDWIELLLQRDIYGLEFARTLPRSVPLRQKLLELILAAQRRQTASVLIGRSSGARVATLAAMSTRVHAVICIGYPFRAPGQPLEPERFAHLATIPVRTLIIQGDKDPYGGPELVRREYALSSNVTLHGISADHNFALPEREWDELASLIRGFADPPVRLGEPIRFGSRDLGSGFLGQGFHPPEDWGVWASERECRVSFRLADGYARRALSLEIESWYNLPGGVETIDVDVAVNAIPVGCLTATRRVGTFVLDIPGAVVQPGGEMAIVFHMPQPRSPKELGRNDDNRPLGIGLRALTMNAR